MKRICLILLTLALLAATLASGGAERGLTQRRFQGLWEGVDVNDGSKRTISITDHDGDGTFEVAARDTYWTLCAGDRGLELASGGVGEDGVLRTDGRVTCFESAIEVPVQQSYEFSRSEDTLFATPHGTSLIPITLHRVSESYRTP